MDQAVQRRSHAARVSRSHVGAAQRIRSRRHDAAIPAAARAERGAQPDDATRRRPERVLRLIGLVGNRRFADLPRPILGVLIGGDSGPFVLGARAAARLADTDRTRWSSSRGGSAIVTTSARTRTERRRRARIDADGAGVVASLSSRRSRQSLLRHPRARRCVRRDVRQRCDAVRSGGDGTPGAHLRSRRRGPEGRDHSVKSVSYRTMMALLPKRLVARHRPVSRRVRCGRVTVRWSNERDVAVGTPACRVARNRRDGRARASR